MELEWVMNDIMKDIVAFFDELWMTKVHNQGIMHDKNVTI